MAQDAPSLQVGITSTQRLIDLCWSRREPPADLWPYRVSYRDALNSSFELDALCLCQSPTLELKTLLGQPVGFGVMTGHGQRRWLSGIVSQVRMHGDEGGFVLIGLRVESALSLLGRRRTSRVFQGKSVPQIVATILDEHRHGNPQIAAAFDREEALTRVYAPRSYCVQFNESDQQFIDRLLAEEGITYRFVFEEEVLVHRLVLSDTPLPTGEIDRALHYRPHAATVGDEESALTAWQAHRQLMGSTVALASYDYQPAMQLQGLESSIQQQGATGLQAASTLGEYHAHTVYYADNNSDMDRYARLRVQAQELQAKTFFGQGRLRNLTTGQGFVLKDHPSHRADPVDQRSFVITGLNFRACNNLPEAWDVPEGLLARMPIEPSGLHVGPMDGRMELADTAGSYFSYFSAVRRDIPLVPAYADTLRKPTAHGPQIAQVVGPVGEEVYTDALGRIYIQLFWQRPAEHPGGTAEFNERSSTAVRVVMPSAGQGFGHQFVPRIGQEVLVDFLLGDIDRPVVVGVLYNGQHPTPAFSGATSLPGNKALSGIRSREHKGSDYSELLMDDTPGQVRARLAATPHATELNLGRLSTPRQDGKAQLRGDGAELRSDAAIAVRAATGLLLTTYGRIKAQGTHLDRQELLELLDDCGELLRGLGQTALERGAKGADDGGLAQLQDALSAWPEADRGDGAPLVAVAGEAGIVSVSAQSQLHYAAKNHDVVATDHVQLTSGGVTTLQAGRGMSLYAQDDGICAIANRGKVLLQAQDDDIALNAQSNLHASASEGEVLVTAPTIRFVADDGSYIRIGNGIEIGTQSDVKVHGAKHDWLGPKVENVSVPAFGRSLADQQFLFHYPGHSADKPMLALGHAYRMTLEDGSEVEGVTTADGLAELVERDSMQRVLVSAIQEYEPEGSSQSEMAASEDSSGYNEQFRLVSSGDDATSLAGRKYRIHGSDGQVWEGVTDSQGMTERVHTDEQVSLRLELVAPDEGVTIT